MIGDKFGFTIGLSVFLIVFCIHWSVYVFIEVYQVPCWDIALEMYRRVVEKKSVRNNEMDKEVEMLTI